MLSLFNTSLSSRIMAFIVLPIKSDNSNYMQLEARDGVLEGTGIYKDKEFAIMKWHMTKGVKIIEHIHRECNEWIILVSGKLKLVWENNERILNPCDYLCFNINVPHFGEAIEESVALTITMPADEGYPNVTGR